MKKIIARSKLAGLVLLSLMLCNTALAQQGPDNVEGNWIIYSTNVENGEVVVKHVQIAQDGNRITGHFDGPNQSGPIEGEVNAHRIRFSTVTKNVLHFGGDIFGDTMNGSYGIRGKRASWEAIRTTAASQDYPTGTVLSGMPMLLPASPAPAPQYSAPTPASTAPQSTSEPAAQPSSQSPSAGDSSQSNSSPAPAPADCRSARLARRAHRALSRCSRRASSGRGRLSRTNRVRRLLDVTEQVLDRDGYGAGSRPGTMGRQHQGAHSISVGAS